MTVTLDMEEYTVSEDVSFLDVTVSINGTLERNVEVVIETSPNTAFGRLIYFHLKMYCCTLTLLFFTLDPDDFMSLVETLTFMISPDSRVVHITLEDDDILEDTELFVVQLRSVDPAVLLPRPFSPITLLDTSGTGCSYMYVASSPGSHQTKPYSFQSLKCGSIYVCTHACRVFVFTC